MTSRTRKSYNIIKTKNPAISSILSSTIGNDLYFEFNDLLGSRLDINVCYCTELLKRQKKLIHHIIKLAESEAAKEESKNSNLDEVLDKYANFVKETPS